MHNKKKKVVKRSTKAKSLKKSSSNSLKKLSSNTVQPMNATNKTIYRILYFQMVLFILLVAFVLFLLLTDRSNQVPNTVVELTNTSVIDVSFIF